MSSDGDTSKYGDATFTGFVKWFNRTGGWGFLTVVGGEYDGEDIFVHWNSLQVGEEQYRYLLNDESVSFEVSYNKDAKHPYQAVNVRGVTGKLMCERRNDKFKNVTTEGETTHRRVTKRGAGPRGRRPRGQGQERPSYNDEQGNRWVMVSSRRGNRSRPREQEQRE
jgi:cold shock CspA family protein